MRWRDWGAKHLWGDGMGLSSPIPAGIGALSALISLYLHTGSLSRELPPELVNLTSLTNLNLEDKTLSGVVQFSLAKITNLSYVYLHNNNFTMDVPPDTIYDKEKVLAYLTTLKPKHQEIA